MKLRILILLFFAGTSSEISAQGVITLQSGNTMNIESSLDSAVYHAQNGDFIYLPGGVVVGTNVIINKKLTILGAGYHPDSSNSTSATLCNFPITFFAGSDSSYLSGIDCSQTITIEASNITVQRCKIGMIHLESGNSNIRILENVIQGEPSIRTNPISNSIYPGCQIVQNLIYGNVTSQSGNNGFNLVNFKNNLFFSASYIPQSGQSLGSCSFENNVFSTSSTYPIPGSSTTVNNNLFVSPNYYSLNTSNRFSEPINNIFINFTPGSTSWDPSHDFHLKPGCNGIGLGSDGTDVGVYGTTSPFKDGGIPFNPHFQNVTIPSSTSANGTLDIDITVKAQTK